MFMLWTQAFRGICPRFGGKWIFNKLRCFGYSNLSTMSSSSCDSMDQNIYICYADEPVYLKRIRLSGQDIESETRGVVSNYCGENWISYLIFPRCTEQSDGLLGYIRSAVSSQEVYRKSVDWNTAVFSHCVSFSGNTFSAPDEGGRLKRGVCVSRQMGEDVENPIANELIDFAKERFSVWKFSKCERSPITLRCVAGATENDNERHYAVTSPEQFRGTNCDQPASPIFYNASVSPVYHSYEDARKTLEMCGDMPEVVELLKITDAHVSKKSIQECVETSLNHPFVVVEGLDATGKTTLTQILEKKLGAARYYTPPQHINHLRPFFDKLPEIVRRAYYSMGNYIVAMEIVKECQSRPVIMDRYWHSTTAYGIANETSRGDLPMSGYYIYHWPSDLVKPTLVLFLTVTEEIRRQRLCGRGIEFTFEEKKLDKDQLFRKRLCEAYRRMSEPPCLEIDASGSVETVVESAEKLLAEYNVSLLNTSEHV